MQGKPSAEYLQSTPMASNESANDREYHRQSFDSTYHPIIYELIRDLEKQAKSLLKTLFSRMKTPLIRVINH